MAWIEGHMAIKLWIRAGGPDIGGKHYDRSPGGGSE